MLKKRELLQLFGQILKLQYDAELVGMMMFASFFSFSLKKSHDVVTFDVFLHLENKICLCSPTVLRCTPFHFIQKSLDLANTLGHIVILIIF